MASSAPRDLDLDALEIQDWIASLDDVLTRRGAEQARRIFEAMQLHLQRSDQAPPPGLLTPYTNTVAWSELPEYPGDLELEARIERLCRWNAYAMVSLANTRFPGLGGHLATFASAATLYEVGQHHFFGGPEASSGGDIVFFQGHAAPGMYARAFLEGRLEREHLEHFRRELGSAEGLPSYPHPRSMPEFWQVPTVSMGLGPLMAVYLARFLRYLDARGLAETAGRRVWAFVGDGEVDEPETLAGLALAAREGLDNLTFVVNCNLQRLDGPVRGNHRITDELESAFAGAGWRVIKTLWASEWRPIEEAAPLALARRAREVTDGDYQRYMARGPEHLREHFFGEDDALAAAVEGLDDDALRGLRYGGHDPVQVHAAYARAVAAEGRPSVVLAKTTKGFGLGPIAEGLNSAHNHKSLDEDALAALRDRLEIPVDDGDLVERPFYRPDEDDEALAYLHERRRTLGGYTPSRRARSSVEVSVADASPFEALCAGSERPASTTAALMRLVSKLTRDEEVGARLVPIVPDEARSLGADAMFHALGIYAPGGQRYEPVDADQLLHYREDAQGQLLEEGITEAGAMSSFFAAGTAYSTCDVPMIPMYMYYSMFGFQRVGDLIWAAADARTRGFLFGGTAGRTTLSGEGLQHQDGHSHLLAEPVPGLRAWDPAYAGELAIIVQDGLRRMLEDQEDLIDYVTVTNEAYPQRPVPPEAREAVLRGLHRLEAGESEDPQVRLLASGAIAPLALDARARLAELEIDAEVWSVTSWKQLRQDAMEAERQGWLHPEDEAEAPYVSRCFEGASGVFVAASDYVRAVPDGLAKWLPGPLYTLGTDGFGRSDTRARLRDYFEVSARHIAWAATAGLHRAGALEQDTLDRAREAFEERREDEP